MNKISSKLSRILFYSLVILLIANLAIFAFIGVPALRKAGVLESQGANAQAPSLAPSQTPLPSESPLPSEIPAAKPAFEMPSAGTLQEDGIVILSMRDGNFFHLFAYHPLLLPLTRLTNSTWDDITPAVSPDGSLLAYSSRRNGYWDVYVLNLDDNSLARITDSPEYDASPTWSPDGQWLAYESIINGSLDLYVRSFSDLTQAPVQLTDSPGADSSPNWSPAGRQIAFVSDRSGDMDVWVARLDQTDERFSNISHDSEAQDSHPAWSSDGRYLAWASQKDGVSALMVWDSQNPSAPPLHAGNGDLPVWRPDGRILLTTAHLPNQSGVEGYVPENATLLYPLSLLPGQVDGMDWKSGRLPELIAALSLPPDAASPSAALWQPKLSSDPMPPGGRYGIVPLDDVTAPYPYLHDAVDESFNSLRWQVGVETGWDLLSSLENAYFPLTEPPSPGAGLNWLLTGRSIAINPMPMYAGWMLVNKEEYDGQVYWRVYLKARYQDGSQGRPLSMPPWDINARYAGDPVAYEHGGKFGEIPTGYWVDFTEVSFRYGWERLPALNNWRTYYLGTRFNQFVLSDGMDWNSAMAQILPPEALVTATFVPTYTLTVAPTLAYKSLYTPTPPPPPTFTPTIRPTWTPQP